MCNTFTCPCCINTFLDRCAETAFKSKPHCDNNKPLEYDRRCGACKAVIGAIEKLESLVYQAPFLATAGMSGLDALHGWERAEYEAVLVKGTRSRGWESKAESRAARHALAEKVQHMGLDGMDDGRKEYEAFGVAMTPQLNDQSCNSSNSDKENEKPGSKTTC